MRRVRIVSVWIWSLCLHVFLTASIYAFTSYPLPVISYQAFVTTRFGI